MTMLHISMMMMTLMTWTILSMNNPLNLSLMIMIMATMTSMMIGFSMSSWYGLILFLIYIGGMMIMFSYFVSLSSNDSMMFKTKLHFTTLPLIMMNSMNLQPLSPSFQSSHMNNMYIYSNTIIMMLIVMILLIMMIVVVKLVKLNNAPLRGFNNM